MNETYNWSWFLQSRYKQSIDVTTTLIFMTIKWVKPTAIVLWVLSLLKNDKFDHLSSWRSYFIKANGAYLNTYGEQWLL